MTAATPGAPLRVSDLQGSPARRRKEGIIRSLFFLAAGLAVVISALIVVSLLAEAVIFLTKVDPGALISGTWQRWAMARPSRSSPGRSSQKRPHSDLLTPR